MIGKTEEAYFRKMNAAGGINGRKINFPYVNPVSDLVVAAWGGVTETNWKSRDC